MMAWHKAGEYICLYWDDDAFWYAVYGHVDPDAARATVAGYEGFDAETIAPGRHTRARWQFAEKQRRGDGIDFVMKIDVSGRGTFPVTVCEPVGTK